MAKKTPKKTKKEDQARSVTATVVTDSPNVEDLDSFDADPIEIKALVPSTESGLVSRDPLVTYLNEIRRYQLLTREQEFDLAKKYYETKDPAAAQELIKSNLRFVVKVAAEYSRFGAKMIDHLGPKP